MPTRLTGLWSISTGSHLQNTTDTSHLTFILRHHWFKQELNLNINNSQPTLAIATKGAKYSDRINTVRRRMRHSCENSGLHGAPCQDISVLVRKFVEQNNSVYDFLVEIKQFGKIGQFTKTNPL